MILTPIERWTKASSKAALVEAIEGALEDEVPGQNYSFS